jgi:hypothetical protein
VLLGLQFGVINELDLSTRKNIKANTNALKNIISDSTLTIELKGKPQIKIPNFANFFIYSNDDDCLHLTKDSRRYFITTIKHTQEEINQKLEDDGYKDLILDALEFGNDTICYLKNHFENVVKIEDPKLFSRNAPKTEDFDDMVEKSRPGIHRALDYRLESNIYPFENCDSWTETRTDLNNKNINTTTKAQFSGLVIAEELLTTCVSDKILSREHITRDLIISWCNQRSIPWVNKDGQNLPTKQIIIKNNGATHKPRAYLIKDLDVGGRKLSTMTEGELGQHHSHSHSFLLLNSTNYGQHKDRSENVYAETDKRHIDF